MLCGQSLKLGEDIVQQTEKGVAGLQRACRLRSDNKHFYTGQTVHKSGCQDYCISNIIKRDLKRKEREGSSEQLQTTFRSKQAKFDRSTDCLFCGLSVKSCQKKGDSVYQVRSFSFQTQIEEHCLQRGEAVLGRIQAVNDLPAADALHHKQCSLNFRTVKYIPYAYRLST